MLILLVVAINGCLDSRKENALKDYNREVSSIIRESDRQIGAEFFNLLRQRGSESPQDLQTAISGYRAQAETQLRQAEDLDVPDDMEAAQRSFLDHAAVPARRPRLHRRADPHRPRRTTPRPRTPRSGRSPARCRPSSPPTSSTTRRTVPLIKGALDDNEVGGQQIARSKFLPGIEWLEPQFVGDALGQQVSGGNGNRRPRARPGPARHARSSRPSAARPACNRARPRTASLPRTTSPSS